MTPFRPQLSHRKLSQAAKLALIAVLCLAVLFSFHTLSVLIFAVLGQVPGSASWSQATILFGVLAIASITVCGQSLIAPQPLHQWLGTISSAASGAVLGTFVAGRVSGAQTSWAIVGVVAGCVLLGAIAFWSYGARKGESRRLVGGAIALINGLCAYALAFGLGSWFFAALTVNSWILASVLGTATLFSLFATRRSLTILKRCL